MSAMLGDRLGLDGTVGQCIWLGAEQCAVRGLVCDCKYAECMYDIFELSLVDPIIHYTWQPHFQSPHWENVLILFPLHGFFLDLRINFYE